MSTFLLRTGRVARLVALSALACALGCRARDASTSRAPAAPAHVARRFLDGTDSLWVVAFSDTAFQSPSFLTADRDRLYLADPAGATIDAFDLRGGRRLWRRTVAGQHPRAVTGLRSGGVAYAQDDGGVIGVFDADGRPGPGVAAPDIRSVGALCELSDGAFLVSSVNASASLAIVERPAHVRRAVSLPWADVTDGVRGQLWLAAASKDCVGALTYGRGFASFLGEAFGAPSPYVESFDVPNLVERVTRSGDTVLTQRTVSEHRAAALDLAVDGDVVAVSFDGQTDDRGHLLDFYRLTDGTYLASRRLARRPSAFTMRDGIAVTITRTPDGYLMAAWREPGLAARR